MAAAKFTSAIKALGHLPYLFLCHHCSISLPYVCNREVSPQKLKGV
ncbi:hypothetical protein QYM12_10640 [Bacillus pacificus]|nr:hypothetical protein [Bacillus pacificus]